MQGNCSQGVHVRPSAEYATVSRHLSILKEAGIVAEDRKDGNMVFYRLEVRCIAGFFKCVTEVVKQRRESLRSI